MNEDQWPSRVQIVSSTDRKRKYLSLNGVILKPCCHKWHKIIFIYYSTYYIKNIYLWILYSVRLYLLGNYFSDYMLTNYPLHNLLQSKAIHWAHKFLGVISTNKKTEWTMSRLSRSETTVLKQSYM